jgi:transposase
MLKEKFMWHHRAKHFLPSCCHTSKKCIAFLKENKASVMDWLGNSPDLDPLENLWSILKGKLKENHKLTSLSNLIRAIKQE